MTLFGRTEPLATASRALADAEAGRGKALVVTGEPGIGKSALARSLANDAEARGARVGFGRAWEVGGAPAFWPWSQALGDLGLDLDELLGNLPGATAGTQRLVAFDRVVRAVSALDAPVVVVLDDLHAADIASLELALAFGRALARRRVLLVVTTRENELLERKEIAELVGKLVREGVAVPLRRLDADATATWLSTIGFKGDPTEIHRLSEGNPLFIEEAVRLGVDRFANAAAGGAALVLAEHLARMSGTARETLAIASVLGREASRDDLVALGAGTLDQVDAAAREGQHAGVLSASAPSNDALVFSHVLLRDSLYETLAPSRRALLHARAAERIEARRGAAALVARHLLAAGEAADARSVVRAVCRAAEDEVARHATDSAVAMIVDARTRLADRLDPPTQLALDLGEVEALMRSTPSDEVRARSADCAARAKQQGLMLEHARAALAYGRQFITGVVDPQMVRLLEEALAQVPNEERSLRALLLARLGAALSPPTREEDMTRALAYAREAIAIARESNDVPTLLQTLLWGTSALVYLIPLEERVELTSEIVSLAREHGAELALAEFGGFHAISLLEVGRPIAARYEADAYIRLIESLPLPNLQWKASAMRGTIAAFEGRIDEARTHGEAVRSAALANPHAAGGWVLFEVGFCSCTLDLQRLRERLIELNAVAARAPIIAKFIALFGLLFGKNERVPSLAELPRGLPGVLMAGQAAVLLGSIELANEVYEPLLRFAPLGRLFGGLSGVFPVGPVSRILGELALMRGDEARARDHFETAIVESRQMQAAPFIALSEDGLARASGEKVEAAPTAVAKPVAPEMGVTLVREGDVWLVTATSSTPFRVKHAKGFEYLDHLLRSPAREVYVLVLGGAGEGPEDAGTILDDKAKRAYKDRVEDLEDELAEAERLGDRGRATRAREELEAVAEQLASAVGLGGRDRKAASNVERARVNVQRRIKDAIRRIGEHDAALGRYLDATVRTGTYCVYNPV